MALYRALSRLSGVAERGALTPLAHLTPEQIGKLERTGAVARVSPPPLSELPGWSARAGKLAKVGIVDAEQLAEVDTQLIRSALRVKEETARRYKQEARSCLTLETIP